jgi:hypothetical protein
MLRNAQNMVCDNIGLTMMCGEVRGALRANAPRHAQQR